MSNTYKISFMYLMNDIFLDIMIDFSYLHIETEYTTNFIRKLLEL